MNYYPFHLGDYTADTAHLEPMEDLAYRRMLDLYYRTEKPLPAVAEVARLIRMKDFAVEVASVLEEFFEFGDDGTWTHSRCEAEIARMHDKQGKARASAAASVSKRSANAQRTLSERSTEVELPTPTPTPTPHTQPPAVPTEAGRVCGLMRKAGVPDTNPGHPELLALLAAGAGDAEFIGAAAGAVAKSKGFAYAIGTLKRQRDDAAGLRIRAGPLSADPVTLPSSAASDTGRLLAEQKAHAAKATRPPKAVVELLQKARTA